MLIAAGLQQLLVAQCNFIQLELRVTSQLSDIVMALWKVYLLSLQVCVTQSLLPYFNSHRILQKYY